jgi:hypothetical protein
VTCGTPTSGIGFANGSHVDVNDIIEKQRAIQFIQKLQDMRKTTMSRDRTVQDEVNRKIDYICSFAQQFGKLSVPTTCNYEFVGNLFVGKENREREGSDTVEAYFLFPCLGIAILLETSETCLQFYGGILEHHTAMPIIVLARTGEVLYTAGESGFIFAWGGSGSNSGGGAAGGGAAGNGGGGAGGAGNGGAGNAAAGGGAVTIPPGLFVQDDNNSLPPDGWTFESDEELSQTVGWM